MSKLDQTAARHPRDDGQSGFRYITIAKTNTTSHSRKYHSVLGSPDGVDPKKTPTAVFRIKYPNMPTNHLAHLRTVTNIAVEAARRPQSSKIR
jgi:hypothetical protein